MLFSLFFALTIVTLLLGEVGRWVRTGGPVRLRHFPGRVRRLISGGNRWSRVRAAFGRWSLTTTGRIFWSVVIYGLITLIPYALFVKYVALAGVTNLTDTVPGDFYFIQDASVSWLHELSWDLAGITDKILFGDYWRRSRATRTRCTRSCSSCRGGPGVRRRLFRSRPHRQLLGVITVTIVFSLWATIGYGEPLWFPTFHRTLAAVAITANESHSAIGNLVVTRAARWCRSCASHTGSS